MAAVMLEYCCHVWHYRCVLLSLLSRLTAWLEGWSASLAAAGRC
jgi:hypothetical protein